jgi:hypothetical protein
MNVAVLVDHYTTNDMVISMSKLLTDGLDNKKINDAAVFCNSLGPVSHESKYPVFSCAEIWSFTGSVIATHVHNVQSALSVGNKFSVVYYHGWPVKNGDSHVLDLIDIVSNKKVKVICKDEQSAKELKRLTGQNPDSVVDEFGTELLEAIK